MNIMIRDKVLDTYVNLYGTSPEFLVRAPGRANLIGEHTDYNDGFVMPLAVDRALYVAVGRRDDNKIRIHTLDYGAESAIFSLNQLEDKNLPHWTQHVRGAWWLLGQQGKQLPGVDLVLGGDIPIGAGMSSSAAIGVAFIEAALALLSDDSRSQTDKALMAVDIEHKFMQMPCGIMDQMASANGVDGKAILLDCRSLEITPVSLPASTNVVVMNTMVHRQLTGSGYADRRHESESAAEILGVPALRDATLEIIASAKAELGDVRFRRARHVVTEDQRTLDMLAALEADDLDAAGALLNQSHASLRDDYEVSCDELNVMSELAQSFPGCYGARMMGGGFGGCAVALVDRGVVADFVAFMDKSYREKTGIAPEFYVCSPAAGSSVQRL
jgi:galactokinase